VDLDTPIVIFVANLNRGKEPKGRLKIEGEINREPTFFYMLCGSALVLASPFL
jgi:hypothetical protein